MSTTHRAIAGLCLGVVIACANPITEYQRELEAIGTDVRSREECDAGDGAACFTYGLFLPRGSPESVAALQRGCDLGSQEACAELAVRLTDAADAKTAADLHLRACDLGRPMSCGFAALFFRYDEAHKNEARAAQLYGRSCDGGVNHDCTQLAKMLLDGIGIPKDAPRATSLLRSACNGGEGDREACARLLGAFQRGDVAPMDATEQQTIARNLCERGQSTFCEEPSP